MFRRKKSTLREKGFTLVELMVSVAILSVVTIGIFSVMKHSMSTSSVQNTQVDLVQNARDGIDRIADAVGEAAFIYPSNAATAASVSLGGISSNWKTNNNNFLIMLMPATVRISNAVNSGDIQISLLDTIDVGAPPNEFMVNDKIKIGSDEYTVTAVAANSISIAAPGAKRSYNSGDLIVNSTRYNVRAYLIKPRSTYSLLPAYSRTSTAWVLSEYRSNGCYPQWDGKSVPVVPNCNGGAHSVISDYYSPAQTLLVASTTSSAGNINGVKVQLATSKFVGSSANPQTYSLGTYVYSHNVP